MKANEIQRQEYERIMKCRTNYLNAAYCHKIKGEKDKSCAGFQINL